MFKQMHLRQVKCRPNAARPPVIPAEAPKQTDKSKETGYENPRKKKKYMNLLLEIGPFTLW